MGRSPKRDEGGSPTFSPARTPGVYAQRLYARTHTSGRTKSVQDAPTTNDHDCRDAEPTKHTQPFTTGKGVFGKDAEIRTHQALHEAKPIECPKGDRDNKSEVYFKNRLFLQTKRALPCGKTLLLFYLEYYMQLMQLFALLSGI